MLGRNLAAQPGGAPAGAARAPIAGGRTGLESEGLQEVDRKKAGSGYFNSVGQPAPADPNPPTVALIDGSKKQIVSEKLIAEDARKPLTQYRFPATAQYRSLPMPGQDKPPGLGVDAGKPAAPQAGANHQSNQQNRAGAKNGTVEASQTVDAAAVIDLEARSKGTQPSKEI
jgi:hypothetical protein